MVNYVRELRNLMELRRELKMELKMELKVELKFCRTTCSVNYGNNHAAERGLVVSTSTSIVLGAGYA